MPLQALSNALPDFAAAERAPRPPMPERQESAPAVSRTSDAEWQARLNAAVADAEARLREKLGEEHEAALEKLAETHKAELAAVSQDFAATMGAAITAQFQEFEERVTALTSSSAARLLSGVLSEDLAARSVARMAETLRAALEDREAVKITVRGPASLYEPLRKAMGDHAERMRFIEQPGLDLSVSLDETVYETRLAEWAGALAEVVA